MRGRYCFQHVLPFAVMVTFQCTNVGLNTLFKAATNKGMSYLVFVIYSHGLAALLLLFSPFIFNSSFFVCEVWASSAQVFYPPEDVPVWHYWEKFKTMILDLGLRSLILVKMFELCHEYGWNCRATYQVLGYKGISYSSPTLASAMSNLIPTFTFIFAVVFRMETVNLRYSTSWAKIIGTLVSISGAFVVTLYKGPPITRMKPISTSSYGPFRASESKWVIGGLLLTVEYIMLPLWLIVQADIIKEYPSELVVVFFYTLFTTLVSGVMGIIVEPKLDAWIHLPGVALVAILYSGIVGSVLTNAAFAWVIHLKGPVYVAMFQPLAIAIAVAMGVVFLGETLHLGSVIGAAIISMGFYAVMWGKANEGTGKNYEGSLEASSSQRTPLLQHSKT
ncbi:EamA domain [Dillenia turbinata]|uniref:WAT1-related protein n=1 Tax=Dillenia turbinata TaxID=194707 RepID=A0AAN8VIK6_9MAGN